MKRNRLQLLSESTTWGAAKASSPYILLHSLLHGSQGNLDYLIPDTRERSIFRDLEYSKVGIEICRAKRGHMNPSSNSTTQNPVGK